jgi:hypothetical protein
MYIYVFTYKYKYIQSHGPEYRSYPMKCYTDCFLHMDLPLSQIRSTKNHEKNDKNLVKTVHNLCYEKV